MAPKKESSFAVTPVLLSAPAQPSALRPQLHRSLHELASEILDPAGGEVWARRLRARLDQVEAQLAAENMCAELAVAAKLFRQLQGRLEREAASHQDAAEQERAARDWAGILSGVTRAESFSLPHVAHQTTELFQAAIRSATGGAYRKRLQALYISLQQQLNAARSRGELAATIVRHWTRHGGDLEQIRRLTVQYQVECGDHRLRANEASLSWMAGDGEAAFQAWMRFLEARPAPRMLAELPLVGIVCGEDWCLDAWHSIEEEFRTRYPASLTVYSQEPIQPGDQHQADPRLFDPTRRREWSGAGLVPVSRLLGGPQSLYAVTTGPAPSALAGAAVIGYANLFEECGVPIEAAWGVGTGVRPGDRVWRVDFYQPVSAAARQTVRDLLKGVLRAHVLVNGRPGERRPRPGLQGTCLLDQPFRGSILAAETFTESTATLAAAIAKPVSHWAEQESFIA